METRESGGGGQSHLWGRGSARWARLIRGHGPGRVSPPKEAGESLVVIKSGGGHFATSTVSH